MAYVLYDEGKKIGEVVNWTVIPYVPVYKNILGKIVLSVPKNDECSFVSPKPINRKANLIVIENGIIEYKLVIKSVKGSTSILAEIASIKKITKN